jgi:apolipoprotein N-acyltransferase
MAERASPDTAERRGPGGRQALVALVAGLALPLAFAPYGWWPVGLLSFALLFDAWRDATPRAAATRGFLFGLGMFGHGVSWIQVSIHKFGLPFYVFSVTMTALFVLFMSLYPALAGWLARRLPARSETLRTLCVAPAVWVLVEVARGTLFSGFPWLVLGNAQVESWFAGFVPLVGAHGASLAVALAAGGLAALSRALPRRGPRAAVCVAIPLVLALAGVALTRIEWTRAEGEPVSVALVQAAVPQEDKWRPEQRVPTLERYAALSAPHWGRDVVVWPESALPAFPQEVAPFLAEMAGKARAAGTAFLVGIPTGDVRGAYYNSLVLLGAGEGRYDKHHLVPFGEYLPFDAQLRPLLNFLSIPMSSFSAGDPRQPALVAGRLRFGASICYEDAYASEVAKPLPDANVLVNVSDDAWFGDSLAPHQHLEIARVRALETGRPMLRATNTGISALIDHRGRLLGRSPQFEAFVLSGVIEAREGVTPFARFGNLPVFVGCGLLCAFGLRPGRAVPN